MRAVGKAVFLVLQRAYAKNLFPRVKMFFLISLLMLTYSARSEETVDASLDALCLADSLTTSLGYAPDRTLAVGQRRFSQAELDQRLASVVNPAPIGPLNYDLEVPPGGNSIRFHALFRKIRMIGESSPAAKRQVKHLLEEYSHFADGSIRPEEVFNYFDAQVDALIGRMGEARRARILIENHRPPPAPSVQARVRVHRGSSMPQIEQNFDVLARKVAPTDSHKTTHYINEVDLAFSMRGIPDRRVGFDPDGRMRQVVADNGERVYSVGSKGALNFRGALSNQPGQRFYAVLYPKGFVQAYGADIRGARNNHTPSGRQFREQHAVNGKVFFVRAEQSTRDGQVHVYNGSGYENMVVNGEPTTQLEFMRRNAVGIVEFDANGNVLAYRWF